MEDNERQNEFDSLPLETQMRILQGRKSLKLMSENIDWIADAIVHKNNTLELLQHMTDEAACLKILFVEAEAFDAMKTLSKDDDFGKESARELDFIRHQMKQPKPLVRVKFAARAVIAAISCDDEDADLNASIIDCDNDPTFLSIVEYWRKVKENQMTL